MACGTRFRVSSGFMSVYGASYCFRAIKLYLRYNCVAASHTTSMATQGIRKLAGVGQSLVAYRFSVPKFYSIYTPDYLEALKSKIPLYPLLNIQLKSFDYPVLEQYQKLVDTLVDNVGADVENSWAFPPTCHKIQKFKPNSSAVMCEYELKEYQRNIQVEVSAIQYPLLIRALEASLPEGVTLTIDYYNAIFESKRYVPDTELLKIKEELDAIRRK